MTFDQARARLLAIAPALLRAVADRRRAEAALAREQARYVEGERWRRLRRKW